MEQIVASWLEAVHDDPRLKTGDTLSEPQLKDHVPKLVESFIEFVHSGAASAAHDAKSDAGNHGQERWDQGYSIREVLLEIYWLRTILFDEAAAFTQGRANELAVCTSLCRVMDGFLNDLESRSVASFTEKSDAALKKANGTRLPLIRSVSHELRNMLNSVGLAAGVLEDGKPESIKEMLQNLERNSGHMKEVLDDLLYLSAASLDEAVIQPTSFAPGDLLSHIETVYRPQAERKGLRFNIEVIGGSAELCTDRTKVRQILEILTANAIDYTTVGEIRLVIENGEELRFIINVHDTGSGLAPQDREHIVSGPYEVAHESPLRGSELGLSLVTSLVELLNGSIELKSDPGKGSVFKVTLPRVHVR